MTFIFKSEGAIFERTWMEKCKLFFSFSELSLKKTQMDKWI